MRGRGLLVGIVEKQTQKWRVGGPSEAPGPRMIGVSWGREKKVKEAARDAASDGGRSQY